MNNDHLKEFINSVEHFGLIICQKKKTRKNFLNCVNNLGSYAVYYNLSKQVDIYSFFNTLYLIKADSKYRSKLIGIIGIKDYNQFPIYKCLNIPTLKIK